MESPKRTILAPRLFSLLEIIFVKHAHFTRDFATLVNLVRAFYPAFLHLFKAGGAFMHVKIPHMSVAQWSSFISVYNDETALVLDSALSLEIQMGPGFGAVGNMLGDHLKPARTKHMKLVWTCRFASLSKCTRDGMRHLIENGPSALTSLCVDHGPYCVGEWSWFNPARFASSKTLEQVRFCGGSLQEEMADGVADLFDESIFPCIRDIDINPRSHSGPKFTLLERANLTHLRVAMCGRWHRLQFIADAMPHLTVLEVDCSGPDASQSGGYIALPSRADGLVFPRATQTALRTLRFSLKSAIVAHPTSVVDIANLCDMARMFPCLEVFEPPPLKAATLMGINSVLRQLPSLKVLKLLGDGCSSVYHPGREVPYMCIGLGPQQHGLCRLSLDGFTTVCIDIDTAAFPVLTRLEMGSVLVPSDLPRVLFHGNGTSLQHIALVDIHEQDLPRQVDAPEDARLPTARNRRVSFVSRGRCTFAGWSKTLSLWDTPFFCDLTSVVLAVPERTKYYAFLALLEASPNLVEMDLYGHAEAALVEDVVWKIATGMPYLKSVEIEARAGDVKTLIVSGIASVVRYTMVCAADLWTYTPEDAVRQWEDSACIAGQTDLFVVCWAGYGLTPPDMHHPDMKMTVAACI